MFVKLLLIKKYIVCLLILSIYVFSCNNNNKSIISSNKEINHNEVSSYIYDNPNYYNIFNIEPAKIIIPKNQSNSQSLSVVVVDGDGNIVVFDGGRVEDADYLCDIVKDNGGIVKIWFITHIHDDHIGALYKILNEKRTDIEIRQLYYDFASFEWYYKKMGEDAGVYYLFENAIKEFNEFLINNNKAPISISNKNNNSLFGTLDSELSVFALNNHFELDSDPINNTSIAYMVNIKDIHMLILGDLGFDGGSILFNDNFLDNESDNNILYHSLENGYYTSHPIEILVLSHHGQNGIDPILYKKLKPKVVVWPTSKDIYENKNSRYYTDNTKNVLSEISSIKYQIKSYEETAIIS